MGDDTPSAFPYRLSTLRAAGCAMLATTALVGAVVCLLWLVSCAYQPPGQGLSNDLCQTVACHPA